jgi:hypothetical protein
MAAHAPARQSEREMSDFVKRVGDRQSHREPAISWPDPEKES